MSDVIGQELAAAQEERETHARIAEELGDLNEALRKGFERFASFESAREATRAQIDRCIAANNAELERRRAAEAEIEQLRVDLTLARNECARLRGVIEVAADKLRSEGYVVGERMLLDARFPQEVKS